VEANVIPACHLLQKRDGHLNLGFAFWALPGVQVGTSSLRSGNGLCNGLGSHLRDGLAVWTMNFHGKFSFFAL
jgi:hypothetical protein